MTNTQIIENLRTSNVDTLTLIAVMDRLSPTETAKVESVDQEYDFGIFSSDDCPTCDDCVCEEPELDVNFVPRNEMSETGVFVFSLDVPDFKEWLTNHADNFDQPATFIPLLHDNKFDLPQEMFKLFGDADIVMTKKYIENVPSWPDKHDNLKNILISENLL